VELGRMIDIAPAFRTAMRAAAVSLLSDYAGESGIDLQIYPARPRSINPPTAFVDRIREALQEVGPTGLQRTPTVELVLLHGQFDSKDAVDQADAFVDGFIDFCRTRFHTAGPSTLVALREISDDPTYVPEWQHPEVQRTYYATLISLEGYAET
jgi:hypothetical protein